MTEVRIEISDQSLGLPVHEKHEFDDTQALVDRFGHALHTSEQSETTIVFDVTAVPNQISYSVVALMIGLIEKAGNGKATVHAVIDGATSAIVERMKIMHLDGMFTIHPRDAEDATFSA